MVSYLCFSNSNIILFCSSSKDIRDAVEESGPFLRAYDVVTGAMICYSLRSVVESNKQPAQKKIEEVVCKSKDAFQWMCFSFLLYRQKFLLR